MKKYYFVLLAAIGLLLSSCQKEMTVTLKQSGGLAFTLQDSEGDPITEETVFLYGYYSSSLSNNPIDSKVTDENGKVSFGEMLMGNYVVVVEGLKLNGKEYNIVQNVQVTSGNNLDFVIIPEEYTGSVEFSAYSRVDGETGYEDDPLEGVTALAVSIEVLNDYNSIDEYVSRALSSGVTDVNGEVVLSDIPVNLSFQIIYYEDKADWNYYSDFSYINLVKNQVYECEVYYTFYDISVEVYDYTYDDDVANNVLLLKEDDFEYDMPVSDCYNVAYKKSQFFGNETIQFDQISGGDYVLVAYKEGSMYYSHDYIRVSEYYTNFNINIWNYKK